MRTAARLWVCLALVTVGCAAQVPPPPEAALDADALFVGPVEVLAPFRHGNKYTYIVTSDAEEEREVESRCSVAGNRIFVTVTQDEAVLARTEMLMEPNHLMMVSEVSPQHDIAFTYDPPLTVLSTPLRPGVQRTTAKLRAWKPSDGTEITTGRVELAWSAHEAPEEMTDAGLEIRTVKRIDLDNGRQVMVTSRRWLAPGVGEISSTGTAGGDRVEFRELQCAEIGDAKFGECGIPIVRELR